MDQVIQKNRPHLRKRLHLQPISPAAQGQLKSQVHQVLIETNPAHPEEKFQIQKMHLKAVSLPAAKRAVQTKNHQRAVNHHQVKKAAAVHEADGRI